MGPSQPRSTELVPRLSVDQLLWVANTRHGPGGHWFARVVEDTGDHDHLLEVADATGYLERHHVPLPEEAPGEAHLERLRAIREMIRGLLDPVAPPWSADVLGILAATSFVLGPDRSIRAAGAGWDAFIGDLLVPLGDLVGHRDRLRACGNPHCRLVFLDLSRNASRRWCDTTGCGNRDRVRRYRAARG